MKELTNNQQEAVKLFNNHVELGDFWDEAETPTEATDYITMMIQHKKKHCMLSFGKI